MKYHDFTFDLEPHSSRVLEIAFKAADLFDYWFGASGPVTLQVGSKEVKLETHKSRVCEPHEAPGFLKDAGDVDGIEVKNDTDKPVNVVVRFRVKQSG